jgi:hypothetical protein
VGNIKNRHACTEIRDVWVKFDYLHPDGEENKEQDVNERKKMRMVHDTFKAALITLKYFWLISTKLHPQ